MHYVLVQNNNWQFYLYEHTNALSWTYLMFRIYLQMQHVLCRIHTQYQRFSIYCNILQWRAPLGAIMSAATLVIVLLGYNKNKSSSTLFTFMQSLFQALEQFNVWSAVIRILCIDVEMRALSPQIPHLGKNYVSCPDESLLALVWIAVSLATPSFVALDCTFFVTDFIVITHYMHGLIFPSLSMDPQNMLYHPSVFSLTYALIVRQ